VILVGIGRSNHDSSVAASINGKLKYSKFERECGSKHARAPEGWFWKTLTRWGIDLTKIDVLVETDGGHFNRDYGYPRLPHNGEIALKRKCDPTPKSYDEFILDHHVAHALSSEHYSLGNQCVIVDGNGSGGFNGLYLNEKHIQRYRHTHGSTMLQEAYLVMKNNQTDECSEWTNDMAGKMMGLVPYGKIDESLYQNLEMYYPDRFDLMMSVFATRKVENAEKDQAFLDASFTINLFSQRILKDLFFENVDKSKPIIYSGGCALNIDWNRYLMDEGYNLVLDPAPYDGGLSIGALRYAHIMANEEMPWFDNYPYIQDDEVPKEVPDDNTISKVADLLADGKIVGWYQGHGELGPRALGNRSILMRPDLKNGKDTINAKVKHREWWRPFGASVKKDKAHEYFDLHESPYMLYSTQVLRDDLPSITHVDGTCRHQTVTPEQNKTFYRLLDAFEKKTGLPVLLNTSLNLGGKPIAGTMAEAIELFQTSEMDALCLGNTLLLK
jgi:carbamoyltransferase